MSRGNRRQDIVVDDHDRQQFWDRLAETVLKFVWRLYAGVLMTNHFHLFLKTPEPNLSRGMQWLLGGYATWWNQRHQRSGHVFQSRYKAQVVENDSYAWTLSRYVHRNPCPVLL